MPATASTSRVGDRLVYIGGLPTAALFPLPDLSLGLTTYSSALLMPELALSFYDAVRRRDEQHVTNALDTDASEVAELAALVGAISPPAS